LDQSKTWDFTMNLSAVYIFLALSNSMSYKKCVVLVFI
jgi:hypothetical protein